MRGVTSELPSFGYKVKIEHFNGVVPKTCLLPQLSAYIPGIYYTH
jgi:hypothetical protein